MSLLVHHIHFKLDKILYHGRRAPLPEAPCSASLRVAVARVALSLSIVHTTDKLSKLTRVEVLKVGSRLEIVHRPATSGESQTHRRSVIIAGATCCQAAAAAAEPVRRHALESAMSVLLSQHLGGSNRQEVALQPQHSPRAQDQRYTALCRNLCTAVHDKSA